MAKRRNNLRARCLLAAAVVSVAVPSLLRAHSLDWDPGITGGTAGGGAGTWDTGLQNWFDTGATPPADVVWNNTGQVNGTTDDAIFLNAGGLVTLNAAIIANSVNFNNTGAYTLASSGSANTLTLQGAAPAITNLAGANIISAQIIAPAALTGTVSGGSLSLTNVSSTNANSFFAGSIFNVSGGGKLIVSGTTSATALGTAGVSLSGTASTFQVVPSIAASANGITARYYNLASAPTGLTLNGLANAGATPVTFTNTGSVLNPNISFNGTTNVAPTTARTETTSVGSPISYNTQGATASFGVPSINATNFAASWTGMVNLAVGGLYTFDTNSDDGSALYIDGLTAANIVVDNNGAHGDYEHQGQIALGAGLHQITVLYQQGSGGDNIQVKYITPGGNVALIPASAYVQSATNETGVTFATPVTVNGMQTLDLGAAQGSATMGALTFTGISTLNTTGTGLTSGNGGSFRFASTTINGGATTTDITFNTTTDVLPGQVSVGTGVTGVTYHKTGTGALMFDNAALAASANNFGTNAVFDVQTGTLGGLANAGTIGTTGSDPLGSATVQLNGAGVLLQLGAKGIIAPFNPTEFDNNIVVNQNAAIDALPPDPLASNTSPSGLQGGRIRLGAFGGTQTVTIASGKTLTLNLENNSTLGGQNVYANTYIQEFEISSNISSTGTASLSTNITTSATSVGRYYVDGNNTNYAGTWTLNSTGAFLQAYDNGTTSP